MITSLAHPRSIAFSRQSGHCFYCNLPMWQCDPSEFIKKYNISVRQAMRLRCTGEHLKARCIGGTASQTNIVAACFFCNHTRHKSKRPLCPGDFKKRIRRLMNAKRWHERWVFEQGLI